MTPNNIANTIELLDGTEAAGESRVARLSTANRLLFQMQYANLQGSVVVLEGSADGTSFNQLIPSGESGAEIVVEGFYNYVRVPPFIRVVSETAGVIARGTADG